MGGLSAHASGMVIAVDRRGDRRWPGIAHYAGWPPLLAFALATRRAGRAWRTSSRFATEQVGERFGPAVTGVLQSTLGNLPELFVVIFALRAGEVVVAQTSIIGSLFANALLVLGLVIVVGARAAPDGVMRFAPRLPNDTATLLLRHELHHRARRVSLTRRTTRRAATRREISAVAAVVPAGRLPARGWCPTCAARRARRAGARSTRAARAARASRSALLAVGGVGRGLRLGLVRRRAATRRSTSSASRRRSPGLVIVAIAGNAVENVAGLVLARKGQADLAISVVKNSVAQIAAFLFPVLVLISLLFAHHLTFALAPGATSARCCSPRSRCGRSPATARRSRSRAGRWSRST